MRCTTGTAQEATIPQHHPEKRRINDQIRSREVRLIDADGSQLGVVPVPVALAKAAEAGLDLVEVAPNAEPPVCKIVDYGKWRYEQDHKDREQRRKAKASELKEMKYRLKIGPGDFQTKTNHVDKFLRDGHKVKVTVMFRGREVAHPDMGFEILDRIAEAVSEHGRVESRPATLAGRDLVMLLVPVKPQAH